MLSRKEADNKLLELRLSKLKSESTTKTRKMQQQLTELQQDRANLRSQLESYQSQDRDPNLEQTGEDQRHA